VLVLIVAHRVVDASAGQDRVAVRHGDEQTAFVLADGAGGVSGGAGGCGNGGSGRPSQRRWTRAAATRLLEAVDRDLAARGGESTGVVLVIDRDALRVVGASAGDSKAYLFPPDGLVELTADQHRKPRLGSGQARVVGFERELPALGWTLLIASDGLFDYAKWASIAAAVAGPDLEECADACIALPKLPSGRFPDDVSLVLVRPARAGPSRCP
jgi:serine/threonine protein phosphatase PrpC